MKYAWIWVFGQLLQGWSISEISPLVVKAYHATTAQEMAEAIIPMYFPLLFIFVSFIILISRRELVKTWREGERAYRECIEHLKLQEALEQARAGRYMMT